jgi:release factor glutamine methyltransferase
VLNQVQIEYIVGDIFELEEFDTKFDIIVSNPPYVRELEKEKMNKNVLQYEPEAALFVSNDEPLLFYKRIAELSANNLNAGGSLFLEINQYLGKETKGFLEDQNFSEIELRKDMFGNDRMLKGVLGAN